MAETDSIQSSMQTLEQKMESLSGIMKTVQDDVDEVYMLFSDRDSEYFKNLGDSLHSSLKSSMGEVEQDRRLYEEAMEQNRRAMKFSENGPERGDMDFWEKAFAPMQKTAAQAQAEALTSALKDKGVAEQMKEIFGSDTVKAALRGDVDDRTRGEKVMDFLGLGGITSGINWFKDWDVRKQEKDTAKDQGEIKRSSKELDRIKAAYKKEAGKKGGGNQETLEKLNAQYIEKLNKIEAAKNRIDERKADPFADLVEMKDGLFVKKDPSKANADEPKADTAANRIIAEMAELLQGLNTAGPRKPDTVDVMGEKLKPPMAKSDSGKAVGAEIVPSGQQTRQSIDDDAINPISYDRNEPVELSYDKVNPKTAGKATDEKEAADIQRKLDTTLRPDFYRKGTEFFDKGLSGELFASVAATGGGLGSAIGKGGLYAAAAAAVGASLYKMGEAGLLVKDWIKANSEAKETRNKIYDNASEAHTKQKRGWNDSMRDTAAELAQAEKELDNTWFFDGKEKKRVEELKKKYQAELEKTRKFTAAARKAGINTNDDKAMNKFKEQYDREQEIEQQKQRQKLGAGTLDQNNSPNAHTPGSGTDPSKVETAEEQAKRVEEASYQGMKRAMMDPDVQKQNEENAKQTGKQINEKLVGRK